MYAIFLIISLLRFWILFQQVQLIYYLLILEERGYLIQMIL